MFLTNFIGALGVAVVCGFTGLQTKNAVASGDRYSVSLTDTSNYHYLQGNFEKADFSWYYSLPSVASLTASPRSSFSYISGYTLFKENSIVYSDTYVLGTTDNGFFPNTLFTSLASETNYYFGFLDLIETSNGSSRCYVQYFIRYAFLGDLSLNSDFDLSMLDSMPTGTISWGSGSNACYLPIDYSFINFNGNTLVSKQIYRQRLWQDMYSCWGNETYHLPLYSKMWIDNSTFNSWYVRTSGLALKFLPNMVIFSPTAMYIGNINVSTSNSLEYTGDWNDIYIHPSVDGMRKPYLTFICDYSRVDYEASLNYQNGYYDGYDGGYDNGKVVGYQDGYNVGINEGLEQGEEVGYNNGYNAGVAASTDYTFLGLFGAVADTPVLVVRSLFNFDLFGVNMLTVVLSLFTALILFYLLRKLL